MMSERGTLASESELFPSRILRRYAYVELPISEHRVRIQSITERENSEYQAATLKSGGTGLRTNKLQDASRRFIVMCLVDEAGNRLLNDSHVKRLAEWDAADTSYLYTECAKHCGINRDDIEDLVKKSDEMADDSSPTDSPDTSDTP